MPPKKIAKRRRTGRLDVIGAVDRFSALPDGLIHTVLSFLPAPEVVRTCLLSRRWRRLWRSAPNINIDEQDFRISVMTSRDDALKEKWARFEDFTDNLLLFHDNTSSLGEFCLSSRVYNQRHVDRWIRRGMEYCPSVLKILIQKYTTRFKLPPVISSSFCRLKTLHLHMVDLDSHFTGLLCSACPVLEDLELKDCEFSGNSSQGITSSTLKKCVLDCCMNSTDYPLVITVPSLVYLSLIHGRYRGISLCKMDSLVKAKIYVAENETCSQQTQCELLCSLHNVTSLELMGFEVEGMLNEESDKFPIFQNMQTLHLISCFLDDYEMYDKLEALGSFLQRAPGLEKLVLQDCMFYSEWEIERKNITLHHHDGKTFQCQKLKLIEVIYGHDHDHQLIELVWSLGRRLPDASIKLKKI